MEKYKPSKMALVFLSFSVLAFGIVVGLGAIIKKLELTIGLLALPIILSLLSNITAAINLIKSDGRKLHSILALIFGGLFTAFMVFFMLILRGLWKLT